MSRSLKKTLSIFLLLILCLMTVRSVGADTAELIKEYEKKLVDIRQQKNTLSTQIQEMDTQMYLTGLTIQRSEQKIIETQSEIEKLGSRIDNLDSSLNTLSKLLLQQITKSYKMRSISLVELLFETKDMNDLTNKIKYLRSSQNNNQKLLIQVQEAKSSYEEQKVIREQKKQELDQLIISLNNQKVELKKQQALKQKLLADTNNDETTYQSLLTQAQAQLKGFKTFVSSSGSDSTIASNAFGNGSDGAYYSQRDARWANQTIGGSQESILNVGCLVTSVAMFAKKNGQNVSPTEIASDYSRFSGNFAYMKNPWPGVAGKTYVDFYGSRANINQELDSGNYVIVGVYKYSCDYGGNHFVLLTKRDGDDYIMHDPIYGPDLKFSSHYSTICSAATFK
ncbi:hypothetical protein COV87_01475 [Candidatus Roizmanbacteria bacterium CG11_big_fil_rev_8_21_14_0_20_37_16]|uniref:Peptidase C39-like domain-containing protein n=1 Tax=Candidatus Roizmanbacteria bacterium CG11_big_fil_rev_8_21_14_0_20_37_16 TaxID=1974857 RepID=A0A2H0KKI9_9BACT|nr:MAG: hypothetical protein COV87_01475 [Candidatus Roizmanbacteria bacterium CG11_big_fil_rev_8_21_14_0_20_37_16]